MPRKAINETKTRWSGFLRGDGSKGIRNLVLAAYTVECAHHVARRIAEAEKGVHLVGFHGCNGNVYAERLLASLTGHPNVGAVLFVGLGCEYLRAKDLCDQTRSSGRLADWLLIETEGGTEATIRKGREIVRRMQKELHRTSRRVVMGFEDLVVGCECGGSDTTSGLVGNPLAGLFVDRLIDLGGRAVFEEIVELVGLLPHLQTRAATTRARIELTSAYRKMERYCRRVRHYSIAPGNYAGGLSTIEEKSLGAFAKAGSRPIQGVLKAAERPRGPGLWLMDTVPDRHHMDFGYSDANDSIGMTELLSAGAHLLFYITGRGSVIGSAIAPVVKITGNPHTFIRMAEDMDVNAGAILEGESDFVNAADGLVERVIRVCGGERTKAEILGHREYFIPYKYQTCRVDQSGAVARGEGRP
jgi:altronate dehydratase large subunit